MRHSVLLDSGSNALSAIACVAAIAASPSLAAKEDIEFVQEHLPEVAMDNRYATLPLWSSTMSGDDRTALEVQSAFGSTGAGGLKISGPLLSLGSRWQLNESWHVGGFVFYDDLVLRGSRERRDLQTLFAPSTPITRPSAAQFSGLDGKATDVGIGIYAARRNTDGWLAAHEWIGGMLWQSVELQDYRFDYLIESGPQAGVSGTIDFDAQYDHLVPFVGLGVLREYGNWITNAHLLVAYPLPRRGVVGHVTGPGFDIRGNTEDVGNGKHFGDPSVTFGYTITYRPARLSVDLGTLATQGLLESRVHRGIERNLLLSFSVTF